MLVLICGSRDWTDHIHIHKRIEQLNPRTDTIIHGACRGADLIAANYANCLDFQVKAFPADWGRWGRSAGFKRNAEMIAQKPDLVIAFQVDGSRGTQHTIDLARAAGIQVEVNP